ncbi:MotE family protein [Limnochorda pilosa]|nr:hypothetical protein [Limnochorda pilosa]
MTRLLRWPWVVLLVLLALVVAGVALQRTHALPVGEYLLRGAARVPGLETVVATYRLGEERSARLAAREGELAARAAELASREAELESERARLEAEAARLDARANDLDRREAALKDQAAQVGTAVTQTTRAAKLYAIFGEMRPKDAARLAGELPPEEAARMLLTLPERDAAAILAEMDPQAAAQLSQMLAGL